MEKQPYRNPNWRDLSKIQPEDPDHFAYDQNGNLVQKKVSFRNGEPTVTWGTIPVSQEGIIFCQSPSSVYAQVIEDYGGDHRSASSDPKVRKQFGGHPDERVSNIRR